MGKKGGFSSSSSSKSGSTRQSWKQIPTGVKARESEERKTFLRNKIEIKRLATNVSRVKAVLQGQIPTNSKEVKPDSKI
jgi:hypothetical protein